MKQLLHSKYINTPIKTLQNDRRKGMKWEKGIPAGYILMEG